MLCKNSKCLLFLSICNQNLKCSQTSLYDCQLTKHGTEILGCIRKCLAFVSYLIRRNSLTVSVYSCPAICPYVCPSITTLKLVWQSFKKLRKNIYGLIFCFGTPNFEVRVLVLCGNILKKYAAFLPAVLFLECEIRTQQLHEFFIFSLHVCSDFESCELGLIANDKHTYILYEQNLFNIKKLHESLLIVRDLESVLVEMIPISRSLVMMMFIYISWWPHHIHQVSITISLQPLLYPQKSFLVHAAVLKH
jgi:hypothetical protein